MTPVRAFLLVAILCTSAYGSAQESGIGAVSGQQIIDTVSPRPPAARQQPPQGSVTGHVYLADVHAPARGARVMMVSLGELGLGGDRPEINTGGGEPHMAVTALDGSFFLPHVAPGQYIVVAIAAGYLSPLDGLSIPSGPEGMNPADMKALQKKVLATAPMVRVNGPESARIEIELERGATLTGKVIYSDGAPAAQLVLSVQKPGETKPAAGTSMDIGSIMRLVTMGSSMTTDDQGHFRITGIVPGSYVLGVAQSFQASANFGEDMMALFMPSVAQPAHLTIYSGNTLHRKDAKVYDLKAGDTVDGIEITLPLSGLRSIHGTVASQDGTPLNYGSLDLVDTSDSTIAFHTSVEVDGQFRFSGIPEGMYDLKATNGRIFENPPDGDLPAAVVQQQAQQFKPLRAFADTKVSVAVQTTDIEGFSVTLADTKLPDPPNQPPFPMPNQPPDPNQP